MNKYLAVLLVIALEGCATPPSVLWVTYLSDPPGAMIYSGGQPIGYAPRRLWYPISDEADRIAHMKLAGVKAQWASGATAEVKFIDAYLLRNGLNQKFTFMRPQNAPGRDADMRFALELRRIELLERQAKAQEEQAAAQMFNAINQSWSTQQQNCSSTIIGNIVNTSCY